MRVHVVNESQNEDENEKAYAGGEKSDWPGVFGI